MRENKSNLPELPNGWVWTRLGEVIEPSKERVNPLEIKEMPYISLEHIEKDTGKLLGHGSSGDVRSLKTKFNNEDLLYGKLRPYLNKVHLANFEGVCSTDILVFPKAEHISNSFFFYRFLCRDFVNYASQNVSGVNLPRVNFGTLAQFEIAFPPFSEQHRIVAKIEELFTKLDAGIEALKKVKAQLKRYRQAVLKYAIEGKLTKEWPKSHKGEIEPSSVLFKRIKEERKKKAQGKCKELPPLDQSDLPELPEGWVWTRLGEVIEKVSLTGKKLKKSKYQKEGKFPVIDQGQAFIGGYTDKEKLKVSCEPPTIIFGDHTKVVKYIDFDFVAGADGVRVIKPHEVFYPRLFYYFVQAIKLPEKGYARHFQFLEKSLIPLPSLPEQQKIVEEIDRRLSVDDEVEKIVEENLKRAERLRQSILKNAFEGKLVSQDPGDEPAEKLLERIKAEKAKHEAERKKRRTMRSKKDRKKRP
jgi:type I restriction enzyme S subunit